MHVPLLTILLTRQWGRSTCVPAVFRLVTHTFTDERFTEAEACELLGTVHGEGTVRQWLHAHAQAWAPDGGAGRV